MGKKKKQFINRKNAVTFHLVHRSQHDPLIVDETAPQRVLVEAGASQSHKQPLDEAKRKEEQRKYGIYFDDEYDYLKHLKRPEEMVWQRVENNQVESVDINMNNGVQLKLPSSVFPSEYEDDVGMLNKAIPQTGPQPDWDPDIVAALDEDFDYDNKQNQLEDDFVIKAMECPLENDDSDDCEESTTKSTDDSEELMDRLAPLLRENYSNSEETKSRFTEYSMSSSVIRRNEQLTFLDKHFENFYEKYDDPELGDLVTEVIEGTWSQKHPYIIGCYKELKKSEKLLEYNKEWDRQRLEKYRLVEIAEENDSNDEAVESEVKDSRESDKWDCESILSTFSKTQNTPQVIEEPIKKQSKFTCNNINPKIKIDPQTSMPIDALTNNNSHLTPNTLLQLENGRKNGTSAGAQSLCAKSIISTLSVLSIRPKNETREEKRERKRLLKEYRKDRRIERKTNTIAFKEEKKRQIQIKLNQQQNQHGNRIL